MLDQDEELWEKELPPAVEQLLSEARDPLADRSTRPCKKPVMLGYYVEEHIPLSGISQLLIKAVNNDLKFLNTTHHFDDL